MVMDSTNLVDNDGTKTTYPKSNLDKRNDLLRIIAMITMFIDHTGVLLFPDVDILRTIGRIAFPIFAYGIAVGYAHSSNRLKYALRLLIFGLIAELPYMYLNYDFTRELYHYNVMLFFAYSFIMLYLYDQVRIKFKEKSNVVAVLLSLLIIIVIYLPEVIDYNFDDFAFSYNSYGLLMILLFYVYRDRVSATIIGYLLLTLLSTYQLGATVLAHNSLEWIGEKIGFFESLTRFNIVWNNITTYKNGLMTLNGYFLQARSLMGLGFILILRNQEVKLPLNRYFSYMFYPVHIALIILIRILFEGPF